MREALQMCLEYIETDAHERKYVRHAIKEALAKQEQDSTYIYASSLAKTIWQKHYMKESPKFALLDTTAGVLTQIDNMTCGLVREKPAQQEQEQGEPVAWRWFDGNRTAIGIPPAYVFEDEIKPEPLYTTPPQRTWVELTDEDDIDWEEGGNLKDLVKAIESKLREKNT